MVTGHTPGWTDAWTEGVTDRRPENNPPDMPIGPEADEKCTLVVIVLRPMSDMQQS